MKRSKSNSDQKGLIEEDLEPSPVANGRTMASSWTRWRLRYLGSGRCARFIAPIAIVIGIVITYRLMTSHKYGVVRYKQANYQHKMFPRDIAEYMRALVDTRPQQCRINSYGSLQNNKPSVSILVYFHEDDLYNLKLTLSSILENTPQHLYDEIVVLDDGTENFQIRQHAAEFLLQERFKDKIRPFRSENVHGRGSTRFKASKVTSSDHLVFVDSSVVVNTGWLEPLLNGLIEDPNGIIVPHADNFLSEKRFYQMDDSLVSTFSWSLSTVYMESTEENSKYLRCPIMRGDVLAVTKSFLDNIGNYDDGLGQGGGEDFELSLRTWLCGGEIVVSLCSRVAVHNALKPVDITSDQAVRRIAELWFKDEKEPVYTQTGKQADLSQSESQSLKIRQTYLSKNLKCQPLDWYLTNVVKDVIVPTDDMVQFGKLRASSAYCIKQSQSDPNDITMELCRPFMYDSSMIFELDIRGNMRKGDFCLTAPGRSSRVLLTTCLEGSKQQVWRPQSGAMTCEAYPGWCLSHVTGTETGNVYTHHAELSKCDEELDNKQIWSFIRY